MKRNLKIKNFIIFFVILIVVFVMIFIIFKQYKELNRINNEIENERLIYKQSLVKFKNLKDIEKSISSFNKKLVFIEKLVPEEPNENNLLSYFYNSLPPGGNIIEVIFEENIDKDLFNEQPVVIIFEGFYKEMIKFLDNLQKEERLIRIDGLNVQAGNEGLPNLRVKIRLAAFYK